MCLSGLLLILLLNFYGRALDVDGVADRRPDMPNKKNESKISSDHEVSPLAATEERPNRNCQAG